MNATPDRLAVIVELEARQDEALRQLAELDERVEAVLRELTPTAAPAAPEPNRAAPASASSKKPSAPPSLDKAA